MNIILRVLLLFLILTPSVYPAQIPLLENLNLRSLQSAWQEADIVQPAAPLPVYNTPAPERGGYNWSGLPAYIFTEDTRISATLESAIDRSNTTLDVALYNLQLNDTVQALLRARTRGVKVRVIFDYNHVYPRAGPEIQAVIDSGLETRVMKGRGGSGAMHCKYAVFDGTFLQTGSANWSLSAENASFENMMFVADGNIVRGYSADFEWMWRQARTTASPMAPAAKPGPIPSDPAPSVTFNGAVLPNYIFSPRGGTEAAIAKAIDAARLEVDVAMFSFTSRPIMDAINRAAGRGVTVNLMLSEKSAFPFRQEVKWNKINLRFKPGRVGNGLMHNKFAVIDSTLLINGSFNWSNTAEQLNTENTIFTTRPEYVGPYKAEFDKLYLKSYAPK
ncbi:MAG: hypothetical protein A2X34_05575 [Elusimicrobia bacterium GWC2_51_8]|nr:MAG: hypothetical protein A2X33_01635 [Elusimicrobia bacterium GWA2_51_34]OGR62518.1 MAG: hypothetical protein A2X34_05575 [Elusimicrobia bacterium GWC2_51_8]OGR85298.1 MAG: hypothetical protein A2021_01360 [Elusimicrobia bacterium GWF2_52_66]HAF96230.1 hypothetical protein [Elusimicrobiota bacterium]HCE97840.1 hypothetical protein [Elusimicrobiota bacterium]